MQISHILTVQRTLCGIEGVSKKRVLEILANTIADNTQEYQLDADELFRRLVARERLGSTGIGHGIAIPHCRVAGCHNTLCALITLKDALEFDAIDGEPVDVVFALLVPEEAHDEHLQTLAHLAGSLNEAAFREALRAADSSEELFQAALSHCN